MIPAITDAEFESRVLNAPGPALVLFWTAECPPCAAFRPVLETVAAAFPPDYPRLCAIDIETQHAAATEYGVRCVPALMLFERGQPRASLAGLTSEKRLRAWIAEQLC